MIPFILAGVGGYILGTSSEPKKFSNGGLMNDNYEAKIENSDISIYGFENYLGISKEASGSVDATATMNVEYDLQPEARSWGIKSIYISIEAVRGTISWEVWADDISEEDKQKLFAKGGKQYKNMIEGEIEFAPHIYKDWEIQHNLEFSSDGAFSINGAEIDFKSKTITIL